jgi:hypothetical protein
MAFGIIFLLNSLGGEPRVASCNCLQHLLLGSHRQLRDISHTSPSTLLVFLCLRIAVRACSKRGGNPETEHE